ncbi:hypothetical protein HH214_13540 [Mucilaginibacter robiniae]|uniref:Uncharacterized protein n=1 Tax=Mucilaginibacter robiniae TaxID=2728022 RepID=A0A7L5E2P1_9SPHI|nr:hypothetical protein [Mucilaginibacter robiniae]QJD96818.1 hypothetical protein HH214_13540 [Mucilaginibacter robiniae]
METLELTTITDEMQSSITHMAQMRNALIAFTKEVLVKEQDYGVVPGVQKPTLLKPGAEKLMNLFGMSVEFDCTDKVLDIQSKFIAYTYKATARNKDGRIVTQCEGSVNSYEPKYRYIWMEKAKPSQAVQDQLKAEGMGKFRKSSSGWIWVERTENPDLVGLQNTLQKMAQKRAFVGAILLATNASEFFTQDVEDMGFIDVEATVIENEVKAAAKPKEEVKAPATAPSQPMRPAQPRENKNSIAAPVAEQPKKATKAQVKEVAKAEPEVSPISGETRMAIEQAPDVATLYLIHKANVELQQDEQFIKLLSSKKAELRKGIAA